MSQHEQQHEHRRPDPAADATTAPATDAVDVLVEQWRRERPDLGDDALAAMGLFARLNRLRSHIDATLRAYFVPHGLDFSEADVLFTLRRAGAPYELTAKELLRSALVTSGAITNRVDRLVAKGLAERRTDPADRRSIRIRLTAGGKSLADGIVAGHTANEAAFLAPLSAPERAVLDDLLRRLLVSRGDTSLS